MPSLILRGSFPFRRSLDEQGQHPDGRLREQARVSIPRCHLRLEQRRSQRSSQALARAGCIGHGHQSPAVADQPAQEVWGGNVAGEPCASGGAGSGKTSAYSSMPAAMVFGQNAASKSHALDVTPLQPRPFRTVLGSLERAQDLGDAGELDGL